MAEARADEVPSISMVFDRALTDMIRSRRLVEETERQLSEALQILRSFDGTSSSWSASVDERLGWTRGLDESIGHLADVRLQLCSLLDEPSSLLDEPRGPER
jgi:hypothetical protein